MDGLADWKGPAAAPPIDLYTPGSDRFALSSLLGKVVLVNFWATWCEPCVTEMPSLQRARDRIAPGFEVLGVNYQEGPAPIKAFVDKSGITFSIVRDTDGAVAKAWGARIFPASYLVDRAGHVKHVLIGGADQTGSKLVSSIRALLQARQCAEAWQRIAGACCRIVPGDLHEASYAAASVAGGWSAVDCAVGRPRLVRSGWLANL